MSGYWGLRLYIVHATVPSGTVAYIYIYINIDIYQKFGAALCAALTSSEQCLSFYAGLVEKYIVPQKDPLL